MGASTEHRETSAGRSQAWGSCPAPSCAAYERPVGAQVPWVGHTVVVRSKYSCGLAMIVFEQPTQPLPALDWPFTIIGGSAAGKRHHVAQSLMTSLSMVMLNVLAQHMTQGAFTKQHDP
jgi:hypothetical protein